MKTESCSLAINSQILASLQTQHPLSERKVSPLVEGNQYTNNNIVNGNIIASNNNKKNFFNCIINLSPRLFQKDLWPFFRVNFSVKQRKWSELSRTTRHWLWTDSDSKRLKPSLWPSRQSRGLWRSREHGVLAQVHLTVCPVGLWTHLTVISSVPECIIGTDIFSS